MSPVKEKITEVFCTIGVVDSVNPKTEYLLVVQVREPANYSTWRSHSLNDIG